MALELITLGGLRIEGVFSICRGAPWWSPFQFLTTDYTDFLKKNLCNPCNPWSKVLHLG